MRLADLQRTFAEALQQREPTEHAATIATGNSRISPLAQIEIYRDQFWWRHIGCLADDYPTLRALVGPAAFDELCARYLKAYPTQGFLLRDLGKDLAAFLETESDRLLVDVARVEWAFVDAFDAADLPKLDPQSIDGVSEDLWPHARITLHPSIVLLDLQFPADDVRVAQRTGKPVTRPEPAPRCIAVYRRDLLLYAEPLERSAFSVLCAIAAQNTLSEACASAGDAEEKIGAWFSRWASLGWISRVDFPLSPAVAE